MGMDFRLRDGIIEEVKFHGRGCAISQASASLLTERLTGMSLEEARRISKEDVLEELGIQISPARLKCALLPLKVRTGRGERRGRAVGERRSIGWG